MTTGRKVLSYRYVQGTSSAPSLHEDDYPDDGDDDYDDYDAEEPQISSQRHSPSGGSKTLQYALASSSSQSPGIPTFDTITEAVNKLQSRYSESSTSSSVPSAAPSHSSVSTPTPYERPPSSASSATSYTVATDYAAPAKLTRASRFESAIRPPSQHPPSLPTIDSGEPLELENFNANNDDPFSDGSRPAQQVIDSHPQVLQRHSLGPFASHNDTGSLTSAEEAHHPSRPPSQLSATSTQSRGSNNRGPSSVGGATPTQRQVLQLRASSPEGIAEPTVGLVLRSNPAQQPQYDPFHSQALTPLVNRIVQRRSPLKPVSPIDHFHHDTEAYASGRNSLPAYTIPRSSSPTPAVGGDSYEAVGIVNGHHTGSSHYAGTHYTGMSQYTDGTEGIDGKEYDEESLDGDEDGGDGEDEKNEKPKTKSKFQEFLEKARSDPLLTQTLEEKIKPQNVFADPRRVVFPTPTSPVSDVPGTPVETRHFGPAPIGRVARRNKTTKRVPLTNGNLVLDLPVPPKLVLPRVGQPEVMKTRYTAVTCDPDDFEKNGHFLRQNQMNRRTELFICITMYNVSR